MIVNRHMTIVVMLSIFIVQAAVFAETTATSEEPQTREIVGLRIVDFVDVSALQTAGAQLGDIITHYDGTRIESLDHLLSLRDALEKDEVAVILRRGADEVTVNIPKGMLGAYLQAVAVEHPVADDAVIIEGIGRLGWGQGMENSFLGCVTLLEEKYGAKLSYLDILGLSGYGFRTHFFQGSFCGSSADATCGRDLGGEILKRLGYQFEVYSLPEACKSCPKEMDETKKRLLDQIKASIDAGWPVIAIDLIDVAEWGMITGYQKGAEEIFCRTYFDMTEGYELAQKFPWTVYAIKGKKEVDISKEYGKSLIVARELLEADEYGDYANGLAAIKAWIRMLENEGYFDSLDEKQLYDTMHMNWWIYYSLFEARMINARYLSDNKDKFGVDGGAVEELVELMEKETKLLHDAFVCVPSTWENASASVWTQDLRKKQIKALSELLALEERVASALKTD